MPANTSRLIVLVNLSDLELKVFLLLRRVGKEKVDDAPLGLTDSLRSSLDHGANCYVSTVDDDMLEAYQQTLNLLCSTTHFK